MWASSELPAVNDTCVSLSEINNPSYLVACALVSQSNSLCIGLINSLNSSEATDQGANMARTDSVISEDGVVNPCACVDEFSPWKKKHKHDSVMSSMFFGLDVYLISLAITCTGIFTPLWQCLYGQIKTHQESSGITCSCCKVTQVKWKGNTDDNVKQCIKTLMSNLCTGLAVIL